MAFSFLLLFGLVFLGGAIGLVILLTSPATRAAAGTLLSILGVSLVLALLLFTMRGTSRDAGLAYNHASDRPMPVKETLAPAETKPPAEKPAALAEEKPPAAERDPADSPASPTSSPASSPAASPPEWLQGKSSWTARDGASYWMRVRVGPYPREEPGLLGERPLPRKIEVHELRQMLDRDSLLRGMFQDAVDAAVTQYVDLLKPEPDVRLKLPTHAVLSMLVSDAWLAAAATPDAIPLEASPAYGELVD
ncbi:MAG: hypothetical protein U1E05_14045, partial [Patescibacteria group bacterium]|nr:hypothetical protein [Patescibacteria group bacterium]